MSFTEALQKMGQGCHVRHGGLPLSQTILFFAGKIRRRSIWGTYVYNPKDEDKNATDWEVVPPAKY